MITDRERDALIATKVMGWNWADGRWGTNDGHKYDAFVERFSPSTDIAAAWQVLQKMKENDDVFYEFVMALGGIVNADYDAFTKSEIEHLIFKLSPEIICRAALYAVGYKEG